MTQSELLINAISNPHGISGETYSDGTPMTNLERYQESQRWN